MGIEDIRDALVIRERSTFLLTDPDGNVAPGNNQGFGIYHADTRHLSAYRFTLNGLHPVMLLSTAEAGYAMEQVMTNPNMAHDTGRTIRRGTIEMRRERIVAEAVEETLRITNFNPLPVTLHLLYEFGADFADIFDVRGYHRERFGTMGETRVSERAIEYSYHGIDGRARSTRIEFDRQPDYLDETTALFRITLPHRETASLRIDIAPHALDEHPQARGGAEAVRDDYARWFDTTTDVKTDNLFLNRALSRSIRDIRMLWGRTHEGAAYPAAGTPWFDALFGRDSCVLSMQTLAFRPEIARVCLEMLAQRQGTSLDPARDEEPGKILHELRFDELSAAGELPYAAYFGSVDATPLFVWLAAEYFAWTADTEFLRQLLPALERAIEWLRQYGRMGDEGFLAYEKHSARGLVNQGWKDSWDAVVHADGSLAAAPIALAEAQGYAYAAQLRLAPVLDKLGERRMATRLRRDAVALRKRFNEQFWMKDERFYAMAIDGEGNLVRSIASNAAHCLWSGIVDPKRAKHVASTLMGAQLFSGWGVRTLSHDHPRFNPIGYHLGSVWPHDNSIAAFGLKMYGFEDEVNDLASALFEATTSFEYFRLPELFGGEVRSAHAPPVPYPVACRPQAWAAGALPLIMQAMLGLKANAPEGLLRIVNPRLPRWLNSVAVRGLRVGPGEISLHYRREGDYTRVEVQEATGGIDVVFSSSWPL